MKIISENLLNKILFFWDFVRREKKEEGERKETLGLEKEVLREKHCWELPDLAKLLLACQMNQTTEY